MDQWSKNLFRLYPRPLWTHIALLDGGNGAHTGSGVLGAELHSDPGVLGGMLKQQVLQNKDNELTSPGPKPGVLILWLERSYAKVVKLSALCCSCQQSRW